MIPENGVQFNRAHKVGETRQKQISPAPDFNQVEAYNHWEKELDRYTTYHEAWCPSHNMMNLVVKVHFLPCNEVKITTSCYSYHDPEYPITEPMK